MGKMVSVMLPDEDAAKLEEYCSVRGVSKSDAIRLAIRMLIETNVRGSVIAVETAKMVIKGRRIETVSIMPDKIIVVGEKLTVTQEQG